jgi:hypothetical protein
VEADILWCDRASAPVLAAYGVQTHAVGQASRGWERVAGFIVRMRERTVAARRRGDDQDGQVREEAQAEGQGVQQVRRKR